MRNEGLQKTLVAGAAVTKNRILKFGADDLTAIHAAGSTDLLMGVSDNLGAASAEPFDVIIDGLALVEYGGTVTRGDLLTADSVGRAIAAAPAAGVNARVIGVAMLSGVLGDIGSVRMAPGRIQG
jgi:hypothetical protein